MRYPIDELIDKRSIIQLKIERIGDNSAKERENLRREFQDYTDAISEYVSEGVCTAEQAEEWHERLYKANGTTWDLETKIRRGQLEEISLEEVGRTAIAIRESNGVRVRIKAEIVSATGIGYKDVKINHASE
ncbi:hypothetical protein J4218_00700 [Candidatus Pacearchaeota archaeon]|nr:hypothetical protein [Candidatus Pacearchaeota archaeon]